MLDGLVVRAREAAVSVGVVRLPRISNYTDFEPFESEPDVAVHYLSDPLTAPRLDVLILLPQVQDVGQVEVIAREVLPDFM